MRFRLNQNTIPLLATAVVCASLFAAGAVRFHDAGFFTAEQQARLNELMARWRAARDGGTVLSPAEQEELEALVEAEVRAASRRTVALLRELE